MPPIHSILVANRGEIARRVFRTAREMGIATVAVYSDADAEMPFVGEADTAVRLPGNTPAETYLRGELIVAAAKAAGADAIHPGYGFLSENAEFARQVVAAGLTWIGPPAAAIEAMGSKLGAKRMMRDAGVPTLPWSETVEGAADVGFPLLVKASAGGGGRGMRIVRAASELADAVEAASREAAGAFGDATVFCERYLEAPRHIEVQVFADSHGNVISLFERECSIQRRHQKIVEEAPSPAVTPELRERLGEAAVAAARAVGYVGAGTVEFVMAADSSYSFLEMNTRLQVEHPVTELVTGLDLVRLQILVASGEPLPPEALQASINGHAIEVRLYAEDAPNGFLPVTGTLRQFEVADGVRCDSGVESGSVVSPYYDAMIAKVIAHAPMRSEAAARLAAALAASRLHGVTTNRDLLVRILREEEFLAGSTDTAYLDRHDPAVLGAPLLGSETARREHVAVAALALQIVNRASAPTWARLPSGWRNNPSTTQVVTLADGADEYVVRYAIGRGQAVSLSVDGVAVEVELHSAEHHVVDATFDGVRRRSFVVVWADRQTIDVDSPLGSSSYTVVPRFADPSESVAAGSLVAPMPGAVVRVLVEPGASVAKGDPLVVLEAMKMEHTVVSPTGGVVGEVRVTAGQQVDAGAILVVVDAGD
ncbi:MAG TPA: biotin carboxylase N-terminal domain-containing protein [Mycobacteriales bacterium]|jgi:acetyl/propionyl-CoA carboxylase alpha subunit|nr:biotin carboxylase N-terminal domain-containing protein [Mycobacteriales bacterium]